MMKSVIYILSSLLIILPTSDCFQLIKPDILTHSYKTYSYKTHSYKTHSYKTHSHKTRINNIMMSNYIPSEMIRSVSQKGLGSQWSYGDFIDNLNHHNIDAATLTNQNEIVVIDKNYQDIIESANLHLFKILPQLTDNIVDMLVKNHVNFDIYNIQDKSGIIEFLSFPLQLIFFYLIGTFVLNYVMRNNMMNNIQGLNQKPNELIDSNNIDVDFNDVAGCDEAKYELEEVVDFLKNPKRYEESGAKIPSGILLEGPPGTGKTLLARAVAGEANVGFISASGSEFIEMFVGVGASRVRKLFEQAAKKSPCVIFIDEIDAIGRQRGAGLNSGNDEREQTLNQILTNMDGFDKTSGIIVLAATNRADILDSALTRPGRFDRKIMVPLPDRKGREEILSTHLRDKKYNDTLNIKEFSILTSGFSGADLANLANEAAILSVRYNLTIIDKKCMADAYEKMTIGLPKKNKIVDNEINKLVAYHEAGHTLVATLFNDFFVVRKVTINSNSNGAGGYTLFTPFERYSSYPTKKYMLARLMVSLGGRAAEVVLYNKSNTIDINNLNNLDNPDNLDNLNNRDDLENLDKNYDDNKLFENIDDLDITTGASSDLKQANSLARKYINLFGINNNIGIYDDIDNNPPFLGKELASNNNRLSEYSRSTIDKEVKTIINYAYMKTLDIIKNNLIALDSIADLLIYKTTIDNKELEYIDVDYYSDIEKYSDIDK